MNINPDHPNKHFPRVSLALHTDEPDENGNQRTLETKYGGYNRQFADAVEIENGDFTVTSGDIAAMFPVVQSDHQERVDGVLQDVLITHFSVGNPNGGAIIIAGPLDPPITLAPNVEPAIRFTAGIFRKRLVKMGLVNG